MRIKIKKNVLGEEYLFYVNIKYKSFACTVNTLAINADLSATVSDDFTKIILDEPLPLQGYGASIPLRSGNGGLADMGKEKLKK